jgi:hypothetical protein
LMYIVPGQGIMFLTINLFEWNHNIVRYTCPMRFKKCTIAQSHNRVSYYLCEIIVAYK